MPAGLLRKLTGKRQPHKGFAHFYRRDLEPLLAEEERFRKKCVLAAALLAFLAFGGAFTFVLSTRSWVFAALAGALTASLVLLATPAFFRRLGFQTALKRRVIPKIAGLVDPSLAYNPRGLVPGSVFMASRLFGTFDSYKGEDCFSGVIGGTGMMFSELRVKVKTQRKKHDRGMRPIFSGVFFVADFNKHFHGITTVFPNVAEKVLGSVGRQLQRLDFTRTGAMVDLEDARFNRHFVAYSTDQIEARYILTPSLMETLARFREESGLSFRFSFAESRLHMAFPSSVDRFEFSFYTTLLDPAIYAEIHSDIRFFAGIVKELNLNRRIWSKRPEPPREAAGDNAYA